MRTRHDIEQTCPSMMSPRLIPDPPAQDQRLLEVLLDIRDLLAAQAENVGICFHGYTGVCMLCVQQSIVQLQDELAALKLALAPTPETEERLARVLAQVRERLQGIVDSCQDADWPDWKSFRLSVEEDARKALAALQPGAREG